MTKSEKRIKDLRARIKALADSYYQQNESLVTDQEYDALVLELEALERENPNAVEANSPTQTVGAAPDGRFKKVRHDTPMLSLNNTFNEEGLRNFDKQIKTILNNQLEIEYVAELKIDGVSISLKYNHGVLVQAVTRGDGETGEDVTHAVVEIKDIPRKIPFQKKIEFRGEIYMPRSSFNALRASGEALANARNAASGSIRQLDSAVTRSRNLSAFIYSIPEAAKYQFRTHKLALDFIAGQGFIINPNTAILNEIENVLVYLKKVEKMRQEFDYDTDGVVIKVNNIRLWEEIGFTVKAPKFMIAYKFPEELTRSTILDIFPTIGRTGRVTYNAKMSPVILAGTSVNAATLHNADFVRGLSINVGDIVEIKKAGEVIPKVVRLVVKNNPTPWQEATNCPGCNTSLIREIGEVDQYCPNEQCPLRQLAILEHFVSRNAMNIEELSTQTLKLFIAKELITDIASIYELSTKRDVLLTLPKFKDKSVTNLLAAIEKSKNSTIARLLFALGIRHLGEKLAATLASRFGTVEKIYAASLDDLKSIRDFGPAVSASVYTYFRDEKNRALTARLLNLGVSLAAEVGPISMRLKNINIVITGTLSQPRDYFKKLIESHGGNVALQVTKNTTYLLAGEEAGSKLTRAQELNVKIINEQALQELINDKAN